VVVDTPAAIDPRQLPDLTRDAHKILVPVLPSDIDIHTCSRSIADLLLVAKIRRDENRIGVIANRVRRNTLMYQALIRFLHTLGIPIVAIIRDSQNYVRAAELGIGVHEMKGHVAREDVEQWGPLVTWLTGASDSTLSPRGPPAAGPRERPGAAAGEPAPGEAPQAGPAEARDDAAAEHAVTQDPLAEDAAADEPQDDAAGAELAPRAIAAQA
jgi:chromosome partitioning protein